MRIGQLPNAADFSKKIGTKFKNNDLLLEALTHRSYLNENPRWHLPNNERLEFLGDAVLELAVSELLFSKFPDYPEGQMTVLRAALVNYQNLAKVAKEIGLENFVLMSRGERRDEGKARDVILANTMEAIIGSIYIDRSFEEATSFIKKFIMPGLSEIMQTKSYKDAKSKLQEIVQEKLKITPTYKVLEESGPAHKRFFKIGVYFGEKLIAEGSGASKQEGELEAAKEALGKSRL